MNLEYTILLSCIISAISFIFVFYTIYYFYTREKIKDFNNEKIVTTRSVLEVNIKDQTYSHSEFKKNADDILESETKGPIKLSILSNNLSSSNTDSSLDLLKTAFEERSEANVKRILKSIPPSLLRVLYKENSLGVLSLTNITPEENKYYLSLSYVTFPYRVFEWMTFDLGLVPRNQLAGLISKSYNPILCSISIKSEFTLFSSYIVSPKSIISYFFNLLKSFNYDPIITNDHEIFFTIKENAKYWRTKTEFLRWADKMSTGFIYRDKLENLINFSSVKMKQNTIKFINMAILLSTIDFSDKRIIHTLGLDSKRLSMANKTLALRRTILQVENELNNLYLTVSEHDTYQHNVITPEITIDSKYFIDMYTYSFKVKLLKNYFKLLPYMSIPKKSTNTNLLLAWEEANLTFDQEFEIPLGYEGLISIFSIDEITFDFSEFLAKTIKYKNDNQFNLLIDHRSDIFLQCIENGFFNKVIFSNSFLSNLNSSDKEWVYMIQHQAENKGMKTYYKIQFK